MSHSFPTRRSSYLYDLEPVTTGDAEREADAALVAGGDRAMAESAVGGLVGPALPARGVEAPDLLIFGAQRRGDHCQGDGEQNPRDHGGTSRGKPAIGQRDRKSTRLNSSH